MGENRGLNTQHAMMEFKPGVWEDKTKQMENEKWINDGKKTGDADRRTSPEQGEEPTSGEVMTVPPLDARLRQCADTGLGDDPEGEVQGNPDRDGGTPKALKCPTRSPPEPSTSPPVLKAPRPTPRIQYGVKGIRRGPLECRRYLPHLRLLERASHHRPEERHMELGDKALIGTKL